MRQQRRRTWRSMPQLTDAEQPAPQPVPPPTPEELLAKTRAYGIITREQVCLHLEAAIRRSWEYTEYQRFEGRITPIDQAIKFQIYAMARAIELLQEDQRYVEKPGLSIASTTDFLIWCLLRLSSCTVSASNAPV
jgi:hypothetical protein